MKKLSAAKLLEIINDASDPIAEVLMQMDKNSTVIEGDAETLEDLQRVLLCLGRDMVVRGIAMGTIIRMARKHK